MLFSKSVHLLVEVQDRFVEEDDLLSFLNCLLKFSFPVLSHCCLTSRKTSFCKLYLAVIFSNLLKIWFAQEYLVVKFSNLIYQVIAFFVVKACIFAMNFNFISKRD